MNEWVVLSPNGKLCDVVCPHNVILSSLYMGRIWTTWVPSESASVRQIDFIGVNKSCIDLGEWVGISRIGLHYWLGLESFIYMKKNSKKLLASSYQERGSWTCNLVIGCVTSLRVICWVVVGYGVYRQVRLIGHNIVPNYYMVERAEWDLCAVEPCSTCRKLCAMKGNHMYH